MKRKRPCPQTPKLGRDAGNACFKRSVDVVAAAASEESNIKPGKHDGFHSTAS